MAYVRMKPAEFFSCVTTEEAARDLVWREKFGGKDFVCPNCSRENDYYQLDCRPEVRQCRLCEKQTRLRVGTMMEHSKLPILTWLRALFLVTQDKRGISALQLKRQLGMRSYGTAWSMLQKIRDAFCQRDARHQLSGTIEIDGAEFRGPVHSGDTTEVLVAVESKTWVDERGRAKERAGFAKVVQARETTIFAQRLVDWAIEPGSQVNTDGNSAYTALKNVDHEQRKMDHLPSELDRWLPWVHRFIANAKAWIIGTHHGVSAKHFSRYLAEYAFRFNRRHDPDGLVSRAIAACVHAVPKRLAALCG